MAQIELPERFNVSTILERNLEAGRGDKVAIHCGDDQVTYAELLDRTCAFGSALLGLGVRPEQRLLLVLDDTPAFPAAFLGAIRAGIVPVPVNPMFKASDYHYLLDDSEARFVIVDSGNAARLREAAHGLEHPIRLITVGEQVEGAHDFAELLTQYRGPLDPADTHRDDMAFWLYSSGSTGRPKGVVHLQHDIPYTCETYATQILGVNAEDVTFSTTKLFHAYGLGNGLSFPYWAGATSVLLPGKPAPAPILDTVERFRPSLFFSVPTLYNAILNHPGAPERDFSSVRLGASAAEALPPEVLRRFEETFGVTILDGIGSTEMLHIFCSNRPGEVRPGSSGKPVSGYKLKLLDDDGGEIEGPGAGYLHVSGDSALASYWRQHEKTKRTIAGEWVFTGDRYRRDEDGFYIYEGRADDMIKVGGLWVSPVEVENSLMEHEAVYEVAVVGVVHDGLMRLKAYVVTKGEHDLDALSGQLQEWCKQRLLRYQYPHFIEFIDELPKTATGKVQRFKLRAAS